MSKGQLIEKGIHFFCL